MQETNPLPWGALDRFQAHFIVRKDVGENTWFKCTTRMNQ